jgi:hypothetical protein
MPNGFHGDNFEWKRTTEPLVQLDPALEAFSAKHGISLTRNLREWPSRELQWSDSLNRLIQIYLDNERALTWTMWVCASEDREDGRYWKRATILKNVSIDTLAAKLRKHLSEAFAMVAGWSSIDLEKA